MRGKVEVFYQNGAVKKWPVNFPIPKVGEFVKSSDGEGRVEDVRYFIDEHGIIGNNTISILCTKDF